MPHDVFISHSKDDRLTAYALCNKLESAGVRCWIGPRDVEPGVDWGAAIIEAISGCRIMVLIFSLKANGSRHVHREVQRAFDKNLTVIPFRVENAEPTGTLEYYLSSVHWLDAMTPPLEEHLETVARRVKALLLPASVLESATRVAPESPPPPSQTITSPTDSQLPAHLDTSDAQSNSPGTRRTSPPPLPPPAFATKSSPLLREKLVRNTGPLIPNDFYFGLALSVFAKRRAGEKLSPLSVVAAGAWLFVIVCFLFLVLLMIVHSVNDRQDRRYPNERSLRDD
jgi:hypothetical protein